jgi:hypothetical protein
MSFISAVNKYDEECDVVTTRVGGNVMMVVYVWI